MELRGWIKDGSTKTRKNFPFTKMKVALYGTVALGSRTGHEVHLTIATMNKDMSEGEIFRGEIKKVVHTYKKDKEGDITHETTLEFDMEDEDSRVSGLVGKEVKIDVE